MRCRCPADSSANKGRGVAVWQAQGSSRGHCAWAPPPPCSASTSPNRACFTHGAVEQFDVLRQVANVLPELLTVPLIPFGAIRGARSLAEGRLRPSICAPESTCCSARTDDRERVPARSSALTPCHRAPRHQAGSMTISSSLISPRGRSRHGGRCRRRASRGAR